ncbi:MAG: multidrug efflux SMR transporter [Pseudomonadota bacterium]
MSAWAYLTLAIAFEVVGTLFLKLSDGFTKWVWGGLALACYSLCFMLLAPALKVLPVGVAYAIWCGIGIIGASLLGILIFGDRLASHQYGFMAMILIGAIGLRLTAAA